MNFNIITPTRIVFGAGRLPEAATAAAELGTRAFVLTGKNQQRAAGLLTALRERGVDSATHQVFEEPHVDSIRAALAAAREERVDVVIGIGGGAVLDTAKAVAILCAHDGDVLDYLEIIGNGKALRNPGLPFFAIPTTSGSGAETTWNSVIVSREHRAKVSLRSPLMAARLALVDPELTYQMPPGLTASTGLDALTQLLEAYVCAKANPFTDGLCLQGLERAARSLRRAVDDGDDPLAREDMAVASLFGGVVLAGAGLGAVHGIAGPLGGMVDAAHGALCAALLPVVVSENVRLLRERSESAEALERYRTVAVILTGRADAIAEDSATWLTELVRTLHLPGLARQGLQWGEIPELVAKASRASSMRGNPVALTDEDIGGIIQQAM